MNLGIRTYTPYVTLMGMPVLEYLRYEQTYVEELEKAEEEKKP